jgi:hypothetical protein
MILIVAIYGQFCASKRLVLNPAGVDSFLVEIG